jgi:N-acetylglucosamine-6-phosphate deacetylase
MPITWHAATLLTPSKVIEDGTVVVGDDGRIAYVGASAQAPRAGGKTINLQGRSVAPGLIDVHVHGGHGVTFYVPPEKLADVTSALRTYSTWAASNGVTGFLTSVLAANADDLWS